MKTKTSRASRGLSCASIEVLEPRALFAGGDLDTSFGSKGVVRGEAALTAALGYFRPRAKAIRALGDGRFLVAGTMSTQVQLPNYLDPAGDDLILIARFNADATLDTTFGRGGYTLTQLGTKRKPLRPDVDAVDIDPQGRILVSGVHEDFAYVVRFTADGVSDPSFGIGGRYDAYKPTTGYTDSYHAAVRAMADGRVVLSISGARSPRDPSSRRRSRRSEIQRRIGRQL